MPQHSINTSGFKKSLLRIRHRAHRGIAWVSDRNSPLDKRRVSYLEVSTNIAPQALARLKKLSAASRQEAYDFVLKKKADGLHAETKLEDTASICIFEECTFLVFGSKNGILLFRCGPDQRV